MQAIAPPHGAPAHHESRGRRLDAQPPSGAAAPTSTDPNVREVTPAATTDSPRRRPQEGCDGDAVVARSG
jgi:hypothetical protein